MVIDLGSRISRNLLIPPLIISDVTHNILLEAPMNTLSQLLEIASRLDHLGGCAEWIARETVHTDNSVSQTGTLISVLAEDIREKITTLVSELEQSSGMEGSH
jgi:hypothetical protein